VDTGSVWIEANLKETEIGHLKPGDPVEIAIDAYPHHQWHGRVGDIGPATGAEFALIPPQNASGNWVKVVQRIPCACRLPPRIPRTRCDPA
jgi:membrane fusion protein, multidrug efflux system